jgi:hypothetical protein
MALEEVLKHECESGFVVEISDNDADHKEFIKMVVTPRRDEGPMLQNFFVRNLQNFSCLV